MRAVTVDELNAHVAGYRQQYDQLVGLLQALEQQKEEHTIRLRMVSGAIQAFETLLKTVEDEEPEKASAEPEAAQ